MIAKIKYDWVEGEHGEYYVIKEDTTQGKFEEDLAKIKDIINKNFYDESCGTEYFVPCTPSYFELFRSYLKEFGYIIESTYFETYDVDCEHDYDTKKYSALISRKDTKTTWEKL